MDGDMWKEFNTRNKIKVAIFFSTKPIALAEEKKVQIYKHLHVVYILIFNKLRIFCSIASSKKKKNNIGRDSIHARLDKHIYIAQFNFIVKAKRI